ncbi:MAG TPA: aminotransferase class I/II-fold pyridoxal phosphate-dependent enzyme [Saprospiraceae bacterium]|nr:aminotransferase class I/II-fold pyridoxal phosphate-dependent enzyme [Saprospiraceae bacterium]
MKVKTASRLGEVKEYYFSRKLKEIAQLRKDGHHVLNLGIGSPDLAPSANAIKTIVEESQKEDNHAYQSYIGIQELREAFAKWYQQYFDVSLNPDREILPLIGSKEGIMHIAMTYLEAGDEVLVPNPGYPAYRSVSKLTGASIVEYLLSAEQNWLPDLQALSQMNLEKVKLMWLNYPHMPTGAVAPLSFFEKLIAFAKKHNILIVNDNPYSFILNEQPRSIFNIAGAKEVALELNSLSKSHNMAGWRVGMLSGDAYHIQNVLRFKSNIDSGMFKPLQLAAAKALANPPEWYDNLNQIYKARQAKVFQIMDLLKCNYDVNQIGLFVWAKIPNEYKTAFDLSDEVLQKAKVFITPGGIFGSQGDQYIRISLCSQLEVFDEAILRIEKL